MSLRPALFLDRDGVINEEAGYLYRREECVLVDGIADLIATANQLGYVTCVVTNQAGIARGYYSEEDFHILMEHITAELGKQGARIDAIYYAPYHPVHGLGRYKRDSDLRKPRPGMLLRAATEHGIDLSQSVLVGDRCSDLEAGAAAGVPELYLFGTTETAPCNRGLSYTDVNHLSCVQKSLLARAGAAAS
jgi:D-glycero-D-manno-heptose 1,7-bisphosphate phosphatase